LITVDLATENFHVNTITPVVYSHSGAESGVKGVVLSIVRGIQATDHVSAVSYGGTPMSRVVRATDTATELGAAELWFLGVSVPQGIQNVSYTLPSSLNDDFHSVCTTLLADTDLEVIDFDSVSADASGGTLDDPSLTLQNTTKTGTSAMAFGALYCGQGIETQFVQNSNCSMVYSEDFNNFISAVIRQTTAQTDTADFVIGGTTAAADDVAFVAMSVAETGGTTQRKRSLLLGVG
jgi:hypothetical protein